MKHAMQPVSTVHDHTGSRLGSPTAPPLPTFPLSPHRESDQLETNWQQMNKREIRFQPDQGAGRAELTIVKWRVLRWGRLKGKIL